MAQVRGTDRHVIGTSAQRRAIVVNRHQLLLDALVRLLTDEGMQIVGTALAVEATIALAEATQPDVAVIDLTLDRAKHVELLARLRAACPSVKIVVLSGSASDGDIRRALAGGADAYLSESADPADIRVVLRQTLHQSIYLAHASSEADKTEATEGPRLTPREREILALVAQGDSNAEIARTLWVTEQTVKFHVSNIYRKLGVGNRTEATRYAFERGLALLDARSREGGGDE